MAGRGPAPKVERSRARDTKPMVSLAPPADSPALPSRPDEEEWLPERLSWYEAWRTSPQASQFTATEWQRLYHIALLVDEFHDKPQTQLLSEIRLNETLLGATPLDRLRLRWDVKAESKPERKTARERRPDPRLRVVEGTKAGESV
jgi:hypothetical protein